MLGPHEDAAWYQEVQVARQLVCANVLDRCGRGATYAKRIDEYRVTAAVMHK